MKKTTKNTCSFFWGGRGQTPVINSDWCVRSTPTCPGEKGLGWVEECARQTFIISVLDNDWTGGAQTVTWLLHRWWRLVQQRPMQIS